MSSLICDFRVRQAKVTIDQRTRTAVNFVTSRAFGGFPVHVNVGVSHDVKFPTIYLALGFSTFTSPTRTIIAEPKGRPDNRSVQVSQKLCPSTIPYASLMDTGNHEPSTRD